jgi:hypothetical protein
MSVVTSHSEEAYWKGFAEVLRNFIGGAKTIINILMTNSTPSRIGH